MEQLRNPFTKWVFSKIHEHINVVFDKLFALIGEVAVGSVNSFKGQFIHRRSHSMIEVYHTIVAFDNSR